MAGDNEKHGLGVSLREWFEENRDAVPVYIERYFRGVGKNLKPYGGRHFETFIRPRPIRVYGFSCDPGS